MIFMPEPEQVSPARRVRGHATMMALYAYARQAAAVRSHEVEIMSAIALEQDGVAPVALSGFWS